ncbi:MAG: hypothetical protein ACOYXM_10530 [Actinomycetota bacterium]
MTSTRKLLGAAAFSFALAGGGVAGALLGTPSLSGAQDETDDTSATSDIEGPVGFGGPGGHLGHRGAGLAAAAEALGITEDELRTALQDGKSIAQVAEEEGVDVQVVIDALVADATERLEEIEAALPERMTELVNRTGWGDHDGPGRPGPGRHPRLRHLALEATAEAIGITTEELRTALADGSTVAEVAEANGVDVQDVIDALVADATERIDAAVESGDLDATRSEEMKANLVERITAHVNGEHPEHADDAEADSDTD